VPGKCELCGKQPQVGNSVKRRGKAKYLGGVGRKITGITRRQFKPNLQRIRITRPDGTPDRIRICTKCLKSTKLKLVKRVKRVLPAPAAK
jgi:large subunit ribosomal protein L28